MLRRLEHMFCQIFLLFVSLNNLLMWYFAKLDLVTDQKFKSKTCTTHSLQGFCFRENLVSGIGQQGNPSHSGVTQGAGPRELWCRATKAAWRLRGRTSGGAGVHSSLQLAIQNTCMSLLLKLRSHGAVVVGWEVGDETRFLTSGVLLLDAPDVPFAAQLSAGVTSRSLCPPLVEWGSIVTWGHSALKSAVVQASQLPRAHNYRGGKERCLF